MACASLRASIWSRKKGGEKFQRRIRGRNPFKALIGRSRDFKSKTLKEHSYIYRDGRISKKTHDADRRLIGPQPLKGLDVRKGILAGGQLAGATAGEKTWKRAASAQIAEEAR